MDAKFLDQPGHEDRSPADRTFHPSRPYCQDPPSPNYQRTLPHTISPNREILRRHSPRYHRDLRHESSPTSPQRQTHIRGGERRKASLGPAPTTTRLRRSCKRSRFHRSPGHDGSNFRYQDILTTVVPSKNSAGWDYKKVIEEVYTTYTIQAVISHSDLTARTRVRAPRSSYLAGFATTQAHVIVLCGTAKTTDHRIRLSWVGHERHHAKTTHLLPITVDSARVANLRARWPIRRFEY